MQLEWVQEEMKPVGIRAEFTDTEGNYFYDEIFLANKKEIYYYLNSLCENVSFI